MAWEEEFVSGHKKMAENVKKRKNEVRITHNIMLFLRSKLYIINFQGCEIHL